MKKAYKGFNSEMKCKDFQFTVGETFTKPEIEKPKPCSSDGFHYCNRLKDVFSYYRNDGSNRFCEIDVLGNFTDDYDNKSITTSFKILKELTKDEIETITSEENMNLDLLKQIQTTYPLFHVGGSVGLFLHGVRLSRWREEKKSDIDMVAPYFILPEGKIGDDEIEYIDAKASANDFDESFVVGGVKVDYRIDPKQRYEMIEHNGFKYKVSPLLTILEAKMRYAQLPSGQKHKNDLIEMVKKQKVQKPIISITDLF